MGKNKSVALSSTPGTSALGRRLLALLLALRRTTRATSTFIRSSDDVRRTLTSLFSGRFYLGGPDRVCVIQRTKQARKREWLSRLLSSSFLRNDLGSRRRPPTRARAAGDAASRGATVPPPRPRDAPRVTRLARRHWLRAAVSDGSGPVYRSSLAASLARTPSDPLQRLRRLFGPYYATVEIRIDFGAAFCLVGPASCSSSSAIICSSRDQWNR